MKIHFALAMALANIAFAVADISSGDMPITTLMEQNEDLPVNESARLIGGKPISIARIPCQCSLRKNDTHTCGCTILTKDFILTAAHCVTSDPTPYSVVVGTSTLSGGSTHKVKKVKIHPTYSKRKDDIAVLELKKSIDMSLPNRKAVVLSSPSQKLLNLRSVFVSGWGITSDGSKKMSHRLQMIVLTRMTITRCLKLWKNKDITPNVICAMRRERGTCKGDSGGPLMDRSKGAFVQYGITSFESPSGCIAALPAVFTKVSAYISWIKNETVPSGC